jgi:hypothetical protein
MQAVRSGPWKLFLPMGIFRNHPHFSRKEDNSERFLLFNVVEDIACNNDVAADHPEVVKRLMELVDIGRADLGDGDTRGAGQRPIGQIDNPVPQLLGLER